MTAFRPLWRFIPSPEPGSGQNAGFSDVPRIQPERQKDAGVGGSRWPVSAAVPCYAEWRHEELSLARADSSEQKEVASVGVSTALIAWAVDRFEGSTPQCATAQRETPGSA
jgi:hypothetical protein